jgi:hypothetical protein
MHAKKNPYLKRTPYLLEGHIIYQSSRTFDIVFGAVSTAATAAAAVASTAVSGTSAVADYLG